MGRGLRVAPYVWTQGWGGGVVNWLGGDARHRSSVDLEGSGGMLLENVFLINLIEYGASFCILKYKSISLYL